MKVFVSWKQKQSLTDVTESPWPAIARYCITLSTVVRSIGFAIVLYNLSLHVGDYILNLSSGDLPRQELSLADFEPGDLNLLIDEIHLPNPTAFSGRLVA